MIEDFTTTIKAQLYERVSSPLLSSFFISWCGWNYKFILILFSGMASHEKIVYIDLNIFPTVLDTVIHGALLPMLTSLVLIFLYPIPAEFIYRHVKINQRRLKEIQQSIDDESPLSKEQARKIRREALESQLKYESEIDSKNSENARLKEIISELQQKVANFNSGVDDVKTETAEQPEIEAEVAQDETNNFLAAYEAARDDPVVRDNKSVTGIYEADFKVLKEPENYEAFPGVMGTKLTFKNDGNDASDVKIIFTPMIKGAPFLLGEIRRGDSKSYPFSSNSYDAADMEIRYTGVDGEERSEFYTYTVSPVPYDVTFQRKPPVRP